MEDKNLQERVEEVLLKGKVTKESNTDYNNILTNCIEAIIDAIPDIVKKEIDSLKANKGELQKGWIVRLRPGDKKLFEVIKASASGADLENISNPSDRVINVSVRSPYIIVDKGEGEDESET